MENYWNPKLKLSTVPPPPPITRGMATAIAFQKLTLLPDDANIKVFADLYDKLYVEAGDLAIYGELYIPAPLSEEFGVIDLYHAFRMAYQAYDEPWMPLWKQYNLAAFKLPPVGDEPEVRAICTGSEDNAYNELGLYFTDQNVDKQRKNGGKKIQQFNDSTSAMEMIFFDPMSYIIVNAIRIELGQPPLDKPTTTRFVGIDEKTTDGDVLVPRADWRDGGLGFGGSRVGDRWGRGGVRFSVGRKVGT